MWEIFFYSEYYCKYTILICYIICIYHMRSSLSATFAIERNIKTHVLLVCFNSKTKMIDRCRLTTKITPHRSPTGPCRAPSFHPREPHSEKRRGSVAALSVRGLHGHTPAAVRQLPAQRRLTARTPTERSPFPQKASCVSSECAGG